MSYLFAYHLDCLDCTNRLHETLYMLIIITIDCNSHAETGQQSVRFALARTQYEGSIMLPVQF